MITPKHRVQLQQKTATQGALGQTVTWKPVSEYWAEVIPLSVEAIARYQQLNTEATHKVVLRGTVDIDLGSHRLTYGSYTFQPQATAKRYGRYTELVVKEI